MMPPDVPLILRQRDTLRSYGRAHGRAYSSQQCNMLEEHLPRYLIKISQVKELVEAASHLCLEIGFGCGEHLVHQAARYPETLFLGAEPYKNAVANCVYAIHQVGYTNILLFPDDAQRLLDELPDHCLQTVYPISRSMAQESTS